MKKNLYFFWILCLFVLTNCEESEEEQLARAQRAFVEEQAKRRAEVEKNAQEAQKKRQERDAKGDTVALSNKTLANFLPTDYMDYQKEGAMIDSPAERNGNGVSAVQQAYVKGTQHIQINIKDSNQGVNPHAGLSKQWIKKKMLRTKEGSGKYVLLQSKCHAWVSYSKKERKSRLLIEVSDRIFIEMLGTDQNNTADILGFSQKMDLEKLAKF